MKLFINGEEKEFAGGSLEDYMSANGLYDAKAAVAVNGGFVPRSGHANCQLHDGDQLEILTPMQGG